jgi:diguanylate cyclase (GGDEF)-like protein
LAFESLEALGVGLEVWDGEGRLLFCNGTNSRMHDFVYSSDDATRFSGIPSHDDADWRYLTKTIERRRETLAQRLSAAENGHAPQLQELAGNRWVNIYEARSTAGYVAVARVEVTDWVRKDQELKERVYQLIRESTTDALTGLANRRRFDEVLSTEWHRAARSQTPLSLLMVDTDHFKNYNDHYGHLAGDACLKKVASALEGCVRRAGELVARYGGEEFVLMLPGVDVIEACDTAQKCLDRIRQMAVPHAGSTTACFLTVSIGVASLVPNAAQQSTTMISAADAALYRAKSAGRARYELAIQPDWEVADDMRLTEPVLLSRQNTWDLNT